jgi:hypothetical protein
MRTLLLFLLLALINLNVFAQGIELEDPIFVEILKEFTTETRRRGIFIDHYISQDLGAIRVLSVEDMLKMDKRKNPKYPAGGITYRETYTDAMGYWHRVPTIGVREDLMKYGYKLIKVIVFHELGHFFGLDHVKNIDRYGMHIMCPVVTSDYRYIDISEYAMEDFYQRLKTVDKYKRWGRASNNR